ncbi:SGNH/GDSL hydrolase family protein [Clostridium estertheticum]|uniref:G-D-S-L family lipolytic protein n=2 Tax=Clostridium estertheticum TaxID=238834 RepID=A0A1J0GHP6_9CLOT|nr:SGNH/GDSL hydrolase family protein [Clostridium estertheticum]APC40414.1 G-D-S-L family lipolytic protein [Clostridium estertheticum subsp. estertheticum]MBU3075147.1 SGNH/GDSL hydrolase family protein [Clostridium estertheticum]MBU3165362.1 SGNH/GDSL hydrolase family protein [Clostridium estertheticum]MBU3173119.1 SGNH/GDSL hydrolase family protein [Clostridium estertheticum]MBU3177691.1 SGNH/GDSL hydrolase family protein [Clostridium estertheticum]
MEVKDSYIIVAYGDSITKGIIYDDKKSKYATLKENFTSIIDNKIKGPVYNAGKFGNTIIRGALKMYNDVIKKSPDIVLVEFGGNDCDYKWDEIAKNPEMEYKPNTDIYTFRETLLSMIDTLKNNHIMPVLLTLPPLDPLKYFNWISKEDSTSEKNILHWLGTKDRLFTWHNSYSKMITQVANETDTVLIDIRSEFLKHNDYTQFLCKDGIHPNIEGQSLIATVILNFLKENYNFLLES